MCVYICVYAYACVHICARVFMCVCVRVCGAGHRVGSVYISGLLWALSLLKDSVFDYLIREV